MLTRQWMCGERPWTDWLGLPLSVEFILVTWTVECILHSRGRGEWALLARRAWVSLGIAWLIIAVLGVAGGVVARLSEVDPTLVFNAAITFRSLSALPILAGVIMFHLKVERKLIGPRPTEPRRLRSWIGASLLTGTIMLCWHSNWVLFQAPRYAVNWFVDAFVGAPFSTNVCLVMRVLEHRNRQLLPDSGFRLLPFPGDIAAHEKSWRAFWGQHEKVSDRNNRLRFAEVLEAIQAYPEAVASGCIRPPESFDGLRSLVSRPDLHPQVMDALRTMSVDSRLPDETRAIAKAEYEHWLNWKPMPSERASDGTSQ